MDELSAERMDAYQKLKALRSFKSYHPYLTYSDPNNDQFIRPDGTPFPAFIQDFSDLEALFRLGQEAYSHLPHVESAAEFEKSYDLHFEFLYDLRWFLRDLHKEGLLKVKDSKGNYFPPDYDFSQIDDAWILSYMWNRLDKATARTGADVKISDAYRDTFLMYVFHEIDNSMVVLEVEDENPAHYCAVAPAIEATNALANALAMESGNEKLELARRQMAMRGANARHTKTYEKRQQVIEYWRENIHSRHPNLSNEKAAEWLLDSFPELSFRKLSEYVARAKQEMKELPPAGKA